MIQNNNIINNNRLFYQYYSMNMWSQNAFCVFLSIGVTVDPVIHVGGHSERESYFGTYIFTILQKKSTFRQWPVWILTSI